MTPAPMTGWLEWLDSGWRLVAGPSLVAECEPAAEYHYGSGRTIDDPASFGEYA